MRVFARSFFGSLVVVVFIVSVVVTAVNAYMLICSALLYLVFDLVLFMRGGEEG